MSHFPPYYAYSFTPTTHTSVPRSFSPSHTSLPHPFIAVITGAGKGLGYQIALSYARAGCSGLAISSSTMADLDKLEEHIKNVVKERNSSGDKGKRDVEVLKTVCDVTSEESVKGLERKVREKWGRVDVVVANAGVISKYVDRSRDKKGESNLPVGIVEDSDWARVLDTNVMAKAFTPLLLSTPSGPQTLVVCTSLAAHSINSFATPIAYNVSKIACNRLVEHVANDHGAQGLHAYALHPGAVLTPQTAHHSGGVWDTIAYDDEDLAGAFCVWLSREKREWLSGRYVSCNWDVGELEGKKGEIVEGDLLKMRMVV